MNAKIHLSDVHMDEDPPQLQLELDAVPRVGEMLWWDCLVYTVKSVEWNLILLPPPTSKIECEVEIWAASESKS